ncbi:WD40 repeat domain-containing protein, partial [Nocardiopsis tropica]|uniref:WD40 repeat domain-containing protein n=1 Tax=Nocardiopsis tropica TaxID=109330 RepID=UPI003622DF5F
AVAFNHDGTTLATGSDDGTARLWDTTTNRPTPVRTFHHDDWVNVVAFNHDGTTLATGTGTQTDDGSYGGTARLWDTTTNRPTPVRTFHHDDWVNAVAFNH